MSKMEEIPEYCQVMEVKANDGTVKQLLFPKALDLNRPKRPRTTFTNDQLKRLEFEFEQNPYLVGKEREKLAKDLGLSETQVKVWYQNKRTKLKKSPNSSSDSESVDKNSNLITSVTVGCDTNHELPKTSTYNDTMNRLVQMPDFSMFPMQQWLLNSQANNYPNFFC